MNDTLLRSNNEITLPVEIVRAAGLAPNDTISWRVEQGELRGRKSAASAARTARLIKDPNTELVYFDSDVTPEEAEAAALTANLDRE